MSARHRRDEKGHFAALIRGLRVNLDYERSIFNSDCQVCEAASITIALSSIEGRIFPLKPYETGFEQSANPSIASTHGYASLFANILNAPRARIRVEYDLLRAFIGECLSNCLCPCLVCEDHCKSQYSLVSHGYLDTIPCLLGTGGGVLPLSLASKVTTDHVLLRAS